MDRADAMRAMKACLLRDVSYLCRRADVRWSEPISRTLRELREMHTNAVFFGGTLRSLVLSRLQQRRLGRPRDIDIVIGGASVAELRNRFGRFLKRETRFGGLQLQRMEWCFDVWPLERTWAFVEDSTVEPRFAELPSTTFFNLEAIAVDVWPGRDGQRRVYSGDDQFFDGVLSGILEINREANPFPSLCVVRALVIASTIDFAIGPRLAKYLTEHGPESTDAELEEVQFGHYGQIRRDAQTLRGWLHHVARLRVSDSTAAIRLPLPRQQLLWSKEGHSPVSLNAHVLITTRPGDDSEIYADCFNV